MCSTVRNAKDSYNELHQVKALVPIAHVTDSAAHSRGLRNLADACNSMLQLHVRSIRTCTCVCSGHHCFDLAEHVVALFCISNNAAHICSLSSFIYLCSNPRRPYLQSIEVCTSVHDQYRPSSLLPSQTMGGCGVCQMLAELFF
jgi:hypothetical protein